MASERPKRSRKIVNYGDHLHWVEESQLQKALLRSLNDRGSPQKQKDNDDEAARISKKHQYLQTEMESNSSDNTDDSESSDDNSPPSTEVTCELRLTRLQTKLLEAAGMLEPASESLFKTKYDDDQVFSSKKSSDTDDENVLELLDVEESGTSSTRLRAQRKFAANASPPSSRSYSPVKMHKQKVHRGSPTKRQIKEKQSTRERAMRASTSDTAELNCHDNKENNRKRKSANLSKSATKCYPSSSLFKSVPKTDAFLDYLCFRNTTLKVELQDCMKN